MTVPERLRWAVDLLDLGPDDRVLEIGGGRGLSAALIAERLTGMGTYLGVDRSDSATDVARERNRHAMASGKVAFQRSALTDAEFGETVFDKVLAINVNLFWLHPAQELAILRRGLAPGGTLYLVYEPPTREMTRDIVQRVSTNLEAGGYEVLDTSVHQPSAGAVVAVIARTRPTS